MREPDTEQCADCGAVIELRHGHWGKRVMGELTGWDMCCRATYDLSGERPKLVTADYHYVTGEAQRHFRAP